MQLACAAQPVSQNDLDRCIDAWVLTMGWLNLVREIQFDTNPDCLKVYLQNLDQTPVMAADSLMNYYNERKALIDGYLRAQLIHRCSVYTELFVRMVGDLDPRKAYILFPRNVASMLDEIVTLSAFGGLTPSEYQATLSVMRMELEDAITKRPTDDITLPVVKIAEVVQKLKGFAIVNMQSRELYKLGIDALRVAALMVNSQLPLKYCYEAETSRKCMGLNDWIIARIRQHNCTTLSTDYNDVYPYAAISMISGKDYKFDNSLFTIYDDTQPLTTSRRYKLAPDAYRSPTTQILEIQMGLDRLHALI